MMIRNQYNNHEIIVLLSLLWFILSMMILSLSNQHHHHQSFVDAYYPTIPRSIRTSIVVSSSERKSIFHNNNKNNNCNNNIQKGNSRISQQRNEGASGKLLIERQASSRKNWDNIVFDDDDDDDDTIFDPENVELKKLYTNIPLDMKYNQRNCERSNRNFLAIKDAKGPVYDIYCRRIPDQEDPPTTTLSTNKMDKDNDSTIPRETESIFWFLGKVACISDVSIEQCIQRQYDLIMYHAGYLRPLELYTGLKTNRLQLWYTTGDSEIEIAYNRPNVRMYPIQRLMNSNTILELQQSIKNSFVGFQGEVYTKNEEGFRTVRKLDGTPARPEVMGTTPPTGDDDEDEDDDNNDEYADLDEFRPPTDEEMADIFKKLEGQDINEIYEQQEERKRKG